MNAEDAPASGGGNLKPGVPNVIDARERWQRTAVTAFFLAEARGFAPGLELDDWLAAERLVDAALSADAVPGGASATANQVVEVPASPLAKRGRKTPVKPAAAGVEPAASGKKATRARKSASRARKSKPGIEADPGGPA